MLRDVTEESSHN